MADRFFRPSVGAASGAPAPVVSPEVRAALRSPAPVLVCKLGVVDYGDTWELQRRLAAARKDDLIPDALLLLQHPHTYTLGRRGNLGNILLSDGDLNAHGLTVYNVDRGGDVTYHGPGQLVGYPIFKLRGGRLDYVRYIRDIERAMLAAVRDLGPPADLHEGYSGVWVGDEKICAIGVKVDAAGVTTHGFALNVSVDLSYFNHIIPCGITDKGVTSLQRVLGRRVSMSRVMDTVKNHVAAVFDLAPRAITARSLYAPLNRAQLEPVSFLHSREPYIGTH